MSAFSWGGTTLAGGVDGKASIIAFNQLYSTQGSAGGMCLHDGPAVMWAYNLGAGSVVTSPVLSLDGTTIMFVENKTAGAVLHILRWQSGQGSAAAPDAPDFVVTNGGLEGCGGPGSCDVQIALSGSPQVTNSSPFYDYSRDALYVGDNAGKLHKFSPVLEGTLTEVTGSWPITVHASTVLSSPVLDNGSGNIFVGDAAGTLSFVKDTFSSVGSCATGVVPCLGSTTQALGGTVVDAPIVDGSAGRVFAFEGKDSTNRGTVYQFDTGLTTASKKTASIGGNSSSTTINIHPGSFDNAYLTSANGTGHLFVCGKDSANTERPAIHRITVTNGVMNTLSDGSLALASTNTAECSPVTEVMNSATGRELIYFSIGTNANQTAAGCTSGAGCLMSLDVTSGTWPPSAVTRGYRVPTVSGGAGTSGIVVDNVLLPMTSTLANTASTTLSGKISTTLASSVGTSQTCIRVNSASGMVDGDTLQLVSPSETVTISAGGINSGSCTGSNGTIVQVTRTSPQNHGSGTSVTDLTVTASSTTIIVASGSGFALNENIQIDSEKMVITNVNGTTLTVSRGQLSTTAAPHSTGVAVNNLTTANSDTTIFADTTTGYALNDVIQIDNELMQISAVNTGSFTVSRGQFSTSATSHLSGATIFNISTNTSSIYFSFIGNSASGALCNTTSGVGCAVKLTQIGLR